jgi:hypothetical protein
VRLTPGKGVVRRHAGGGWVEGRTDRGVTSDGGR